MRTPPPRFGPWGSRARKREELRPEAASCRVLRVPLDITKLAKELLGRNASIYLEGFQMLQQFHRKLCVHWLGVFKECSFDPVNRPH